MNTSDTVFKTSHRYLASFLIAMNYPLLSTSLQDGMVEFTFEDVNDSIQQTVQDFYNDGKPVFPQRFIRGLEQVREIIRNAKRGKTQPRRDA